VFEFTASTKPPPSVLVHPERADVFGARHAFLNGGVDGAVVNQRSARRIHKGAG